MFAFFDPAAHYHLFQTRLHYIAMPGLKLGTQTSLALNSQQSTCLCLLLGSIFLPPR